MLSRVADNLYWMARYLERTENLARLVDVSASLMLDLPLRLSPGWQPLVSITANEQIYAERAHDYSEQSVVHFMVADEKNPGSMLTSIARAREIARTVRDILPREVWEQINELYLFVGERAAEASAKRTRYGFLGRVTAGTQTLTGMFEGIVNEGDAQSFLTLGRNMERADMTSRIVDVRAAAMLVAENAEDLRPFETVLWMNVLRSLSGYQMYRLKTRERVYGAGVVRSPRRHMLHRAIGSWSVGGVSTGARRGRRGTRPARRTRAGATCRVAVGMGGGSGFPGPSRGSLKSRR